jgi:hypothetical protein
MSVHDELHSRNVLCALNVISPFHYHNKLAKDDIEYEINCLLDFTLCHIHLGSDIRYYTTIPSVHVIPSCYITYETCLTSFYSSNY